MREKRNSFSYNKLFRKTVKNYNSVTARTTKILLDSIVRAKKLQSCLKLRNSQNPFCHILETLNKNYEKKVVMIRSISSDL